MFHELLKLFCLRNLCNISDPYVYRGLVHNGVKNWCAVRDLNLPAIFAKDKVQTDKQLMDKVEPSLCPSLNCLYHYSFVFFSRAGIS